jgi:hypothetical protein
MTTAATPAQQARIDATSDAYGVAVDAHLAAERAHRADPSWENFLALRAARDASSRAEAAMNAAMAAVPRAAARSEVWG